MKNMDITINKLDYLFPDKIKLFKNDNTFIEENNKNNKKSLSILLITFIVLLVLFELITYFYPETISASRGI